MGNKINRVHRSLKFKKEAVALVQEQGYTVADAAKAVGVATASLYKWKAKFEAEDNGAVLSRDERAELVQLRRENKQLKMEKEILKKASAFFAREMS